MVFTSNVFLCVIFGFLLGQQDLEFKNHYLDLECYPKFDLQIILNL